MDDKRIQMEAIYGWRGKLGMVHPTTSWRLGMDFHRYVPEGVGLLIQTLGIDSVDDENVEKALPQIDIAARRLAEARADFVHLGGPFGLLRGRDQSKQILKRLEEATNLPSSYSLTSLVDAFNAVSAKKLIVISRGLGVWPERHKKFFEDNGFEVVNTKHTGEPKNSVSEQLPMSVPYNLAREAYLETPEAQGIYIASGAWGGLPVVRYLEEDCDAAVIVEYSIFIWAGLRALKIKAPVRGLGRIFETLH
jgi:maleate isomerase